MKTSIKVNKYTRSKGGIRIKEIKISAFECHGRIRKDSSFAFKTKLTSLAARYLNSCCLGPTFEGIITFSFVQHIPL